MRINVATWWQLDEDGVLRIVTPEGFEVEHDFNYGITICPAAFSPQMVGNFAALQRQLQGNEAASKEVEIFVQGFFDEGTWKNEPAWTLEHELASILGSKAPLDTATVCYAIDTAIWQRPSSDRRPVR